MGPLEVASIIVVLAIWVGVPWDARRQHFKYWWLWGILNFFAPVVLFIYLVRRYTWS